MTIYQNQINASRLCGGVAIVQPQDDEKPKDLNEDLNLEFRGFPLVRLIAPIGNPIGAPRSKDNPQP